MGEMNQLAVVGRDLVEVVKNPKNVAIIVGGILILGLMVMKNGYGMEINKSSLRISKNI